jgi:predicted MFS family arabinose efflux permease
MTRPERQSLRRNRDFTLLWSGQALSELGTQMDVVAYPLLALAVTGSAAGAGLVGFAQMLPFALVSLTAGVLVDRWDRRRVMLVADGGRFLLLGMLSIAVIADAASLWMLLLVVFAETTLGVFFHLAGLGAIRSLVPAVDIDRASAAMEARDAAAMLAGGPLGGLLFGIHRALPFVADAISYLVGTVATVLIRAPLQDSDRGSDDEKILIAMKHGLAFVWKHPFLRASMTLSGMANAIGAAIVLLVILIAQHGGASPTSIGVLTAMIGLGGLVGAVSASLLLRLVPRTVLFRGVGWYWAVLIPVMALTSNPYVLGLIGALLTLPFPAWNAAIFARTVAVTPDGIFGRVQSVQEFASRAATPLGPLVAGVAFSSFGGIPTVFLLAALAILMAAVALLSVGFHDEERPSSQSPTGSKVEP